MDKTIKINGKDYAVGGTVRAMLIWEQATDRPFAIRLNGDTLLYYYCLLMAGDPELELTFRDFIDAIEREPEVVTRFAALLSEAEKAKSIFDKKAPKRGKKSLKVSEIYALLTLQLGIAPDYVLDRMQPYEIAALLEHAWMRSRESWEQTRFLAYIYAQSLCKKELKLSDLIPFTWDDAEAAPETSIDEKERQRLTELAKQYEKELCRTQV